MYFITILKIENEEIIDSVCVGYFKNRDKAIKVLK